MTIFRGIGGGGDATTDSELTALAAIALQASTSADEAQVSASNAASSASAAASSASSASTSASAASASASSATSSASSASSSASSASTSATNAASSATAAATSATSAASSSTTAGQWASRTTGIVAGTDYSAKAWAIGGTNVTDTANRGAAKEWAIKTGSTVDGTEYSAKHYASAAAVSEVVATSAATSADFSATTASLMASAASTHASDASNSAANAATSEANALSYSTGAASSAFSANVSADTAATSANAAAISAADAAASAASITPSTLVRNNTTNAITVSSSTDAFRITQTGTGNSFVVEDATSPDSTPTVIDTNGRIICGYTGIVLAKDQGGTERSAWQYQAHGTGQGSYFGAIWANSVSGPTLALGHSRSATVGTLGAALSSGDAMGAIAFEGDDGAAFQVGSTIRAEADGTPALGSMPGRLIFSTTASGSTTASDRMRIDSSGRVGVGTASLGGVNGATHFAQPLTGGTTSAGLRVAGTAQSDVTSTAQWVRSVSAVASGATVQTVVNFAAVQGTFSGTVTNQYGYFVDSSLTGATNNYGFYGNIASGTNRWNFYAAGTAANAFAGSSRFGGVTAPAYTVDVTGDINFSGTLYSGGSALYAARAWVNFNGTGTVAIRASGNVSSITDNGTGDYTVNFATAMTDTNYAVNATASGQSGVQSIHIAMKKTNGTLSTTQYNIQVTNTSETLVDSAWISVGVFR